MNESYLVRGKRLDNGGMIDGQRVTDGRRIWIIYDDDVYQDAVPGGMALVSDKYLEIDPATLGRCTGLKDNAGKLIFEGDIVEIILPLESAKPIIRNSPVFYEGLSWRVSWAEDSFHKDGRGTRIDGFCNDVTFRVIGNIHDNPGLLEEH